MLILFSLVGCTRLIHEPYTASMFPNDMRASATLFEIASFANFLGKICYLTLALWVSHPVKLQSELQCV